MQNLTFKNPPNNYGEVSFYWWVGEKLTRERLKWQLDRLVEQNICGLQINYCHSDFGGKNYGLTIPSDPPLFSDQWWELVNWFMDECKKYNISVSLSDYTLGTPGQECYMDKVIEKNPHFIGKKLEYENGAVVVKEVPLSVDPMNKDLGNAVINEFFGKFEEHFPGEVGKGLNFFFSDELSFNIRGNLWNDDFADEFKQIKGYDITPYLNGIFVDIGDITQKIRLDYYDVIVTLSIEGYFKPIYEWHEKRGMIFGCDHGGRGRDVTEFGDYFRTQKFTQGPGNDQPYLSSDIIKNKVASSISHMYNRPRTWLEGFWGSGWGTSSSEVADATFRNFAMGHNLLTLHGLYYTTYGGYWEWAPPCNHFRMPYWKHMGKFLECSKRLSWLMTQGTHSCDVAIVYPVAAVEGGIDGDISVNTAFETGEYLYNNAVDFDFIDFESIERANIIDRKLCVSGEKYKALIIPSMKTIRFSTIKKAEEFARNGGLVIIQGEIPLASDNAGRNDKTLNTLVDNIKVRLQTKEQVLEEIKKSFCLDFECNDKAYILHREIDSLDVYMVYGVNKGTECFFRSKGSVSLLNPWNGESQALPIKEQTNNGIIITMPLTSTEVQLIAFDSQGTPIISDSTKSLENIIEVSGKWDFELIPTMDNKFGDFRLPSFDGMIGAEGRIFKCKQTNEDCSGNDYDDSNWKDQVCSYGTYFWKLGALPKSIDEQLINLTSIDENTTVLVDDKEYSFTPYDFSMRYGIWMDAGHQGYHGLKGKVSDEFIALGKKTLKAYTSNSQYIKEDEGDYYYLFTTICSDKNAKGLIKNGTLKPTAIWINGQKVYNDNVDLIKGNNTVLLRYDSNGRTYFVIEKAEDSFKQELPLAMKWYQNPNILPFDVQLNNTSWIRLVSPPALKSMKIATLDDIEVFIDGELAENNGQNIYQPKSFKKGTSQIAIKLINQKCIYGSASMYEPIEFNCGVGEIELCDWAEIDGLKTYSGGAKYSKKVIINKSDSIILDLGEVSTSAEVFINGKSAGVRLAPPYSFDISKLVIDGENLIEVEVYNTLYNHYLTIPTYYNNRAVKSGILGKVKIIYY